MVESLFKDSFFYRALTVAASDICTTVKSAGVLFFDFAGPHAFDLDQKFTQNSSHIIVNYHATKEFFPCLNGLITCFRFQSMFWKM